jgi:hypothetical protein
MSRKVPIHGGELRYVEGLRQGAPEWLDEIVCLDPKCVHVEVMGPTCIWMGIDFADGSRLTVNFTSVNGRSHVQYTAELEGGGS